MTRIQLGCFMLALTLVFSASAFAKPKSESVTLYHDANINGTTLPAGDYVIKYDNEGTTTQVHFMQGRKEVAVVTGQLKVLDKKAGTNQIVVDSDGGNRIISEIDFRGTDTAISFASAGTAAGK